MKYLCCNSTIFYQQDKLCPNYLVKGVRNKSETDFSKCNEKIKLKQMSTGINICGIENLRRILLSVHIKELDSERGKQ